MGIDGVMRTGMVLNILAYNRGAKNKTVGCGMCAHRWSVSPAMLSVRLRRFGHVRCPHCGAELTPMSKTQKRDVATGIVERAANTMALRGAKR